MSKKGYRWQVLGSDCYQWKVKSLQKYVKKKISFLRSGLPIYARHILSVAFVSVARASLILCDDPRRS